VQNIFKLSVVVHELSSHVVLETRPKSWSRGASRTNSKVLVLVLTKRSWSCSWS